jgi:hypothetical protein
MLCYTILGYTRGRALCSEWNVQREATWRMMQAYIYVSNNS